MPSYTCTCRQDNRLDDTPETDRQTQPSEYETTAHAVLKFKKADSLLLPPPKVIFYSFLT